MSRQARYMKRRQFLKTAGTVAAVVAAGPFVHTRPARPDKGELVVVSWGGVLNQALRKVMFDPFERETGIRIRDDAPPETAKVKAMVEAGRVTWDVIDTDVGAILSLVKNNLLEPLDYSKLDKAKLDRIPSELRRPHGLGGRVWSFNIVYNTDAVPTGKHPRSWADFWDGENFPGARTFNFRGGVGPQLEIALLADGVPIDGLYPLDVERAWRSFDRLRPLVTKWFRSHSEAIQLISTGEADLACTVGSRAVTAKREGAPIDVEYSEGKLGADHWCIVKNSQNQDAALSFINFAVAGKRQAELAKIVPYGPSNASAFDHLSDEQAKDLTSYPANIEKQFWWKGEWWGTVGPDGKTQHERQAERYANWMLKG